jgi:peptidoglycan/xylan/chitin deacetylase (PgdA/CDA1 family)
MTNPMLIGVIGLVLAVSAFTFWRIMLVNENDLKLKSNLHSSQIIPEQSDNSKNQSLSSKSGKFINLPILMYHHIGELPAQADAVRKDLTVSLQNFEMQVAWLKGQSFESISLGDLLNYSKGRFILPEKPVIFTFDDGYTDALENAPPILKKYGFTGSFAVVTQFPGINSEDNQYADWQIIRQAKDAGMEIIDHTQDHFDGTDPKYDEKFILRNLNDSRKDLENNLGQSLPVLVYPFGRYNEKYIQLARQAGFEIGVTTKEGKKNFPDNLMEIPRIRIHGEESLEIFQKMILE